ncbi:hypothetical protein M413DRAFT_337005 [Hebeloma cylindrosporum]|uniref:Uncharacterized protein n=1 Tax=Hebeloma cylindrosporum TaxID=76867 RepID=A0A0C2YWB9_HEBCY|nr:hypothetical protein M413DRAFT_337005 [Hebeloma cylindrosporum h7]
MPIRSAYPFLFTSTSTFSLYVHFHSLAMHRFNYIIIPALFFINMGVDGATIANTLTSSNHPIRDSPIHHARGAALLQDRQYRAADYSSDPASATDQPLPTEVVDTDNGPQDISSPAFLPRGSLSPPLTGHSKRGDRPVINFRQPLPRAFSADHSASFQRRLDSGLSMNAVSDVVPDGSARPISDSLATKMPADAPPVSNLSPPPANVLPAGSLDSSSVSNAVGTSNLMNSALGPGGVRDELSHFGPKPRDMGLSHGMGSLSVVPSFARDTTTDAPQVWAEDANTKDAAEDSEDDNNETAGDDPAEDSEEDTNESDPDDAAEDSEDAIAEDDADEAARDSEDDTDADGAGEDDQETDTGDSDDATAALESRQLKSVPSRVVKVAQAVKGQDKLEKTGESVEKNSKGAVMTGVAKAGSTVKGMKPSGKHHLELSEE